MEFKKTVEHQKSKEQPYSALTGSPLGEPGGQQRAEIVKHVNS